MVKFPLINNNESKRKTINHKSIEINENGRVFLNIYSQENYLIIYYINKGKVDDIENQTEIPYSSLTWIKQCITDGFWKKPSDGGLPKNKHVCSSFFAGEEITISRSMNAGYPGQKGFNIINNNRSCHILASWPQQVQITDEVMSSHLLPIMNKIIENQI
ncbi:hypothetical protein [Photobacterium kasasachensis]|uniref:hypothetical protein n=1 Tax=Photobacterium kasasachensis TaxID=2910240 RepID=UPI003D0C7601